MGIVQARFTEALMHNMAKVPIPSEDIFSTTVSGQPKSEILVDLQSQHPGLTYHFVEDKLGTLEKASPSIDFSLKLQVENYFKLKFTQSSFWCNVLFHSSTQPIVVTQLMD